MIALKLRSKTNPPQRILSPGKLGSDVDKDMIGRHPIDLHVEPLPFIIAELIQVIIGNGQPARYSSGQNGRLVIGQDRPPITSVDRSDYFRRRHRTFKRNRDASS